MQRCQVDMVFPLFPDVKNDFYSDPVLKSQMSHFAASLSQAKYVVTTIG